MSELRRELAKRVLDLSITAFGLVAALAWNEAITALVAQYIPKGSTTISLFIYAIFVTILAVVVTFQIGRVASKLKEDQDAQKE